MAIKRNTSQRSITASELEDMLKRYKIGRKPFAALLGWGETTVMNYLNGELSDNEYTRRLYRLSTNPGEYLELLESEGGKITGVALRKSRNAVEKLLMPTKLLTCTQYLLNSDSPDMSDVRAEAILFMAQTFAMVKWNRKLFDEEYQLLKGNCPYRPVKKRIEEYGRFFLEIPENALDEEECYLLDVMRQTFDWYGDRAISLFLASERTRLADRMPEGRKRVVPSAIVSEVYSELFEVLNLRMLSDVPTVLNKRMNAQFKALKKTGGR